MLNTFIMAHHSGIRAENSMRMNGEQADNYHQLWFDCIGQTLPYIVLAIFKLAYKKRTEYRKQKK